MDKYYLIDNICFKFLLFLLIINLIPQQKHNKIEVNDLEVYFSQSICQLLFFSINYKCSFNFYTNDNFYNDVLEINNNVNLLMNIKNSKLEHLFLLLSIIPFLKNNSTLSYKIKDKEIYNIFKKIFNKKIKYKIINLEYNDLHSFNKKMKKLLYYKWEIIPKQFILDNLRYIINNSYKESNLAILQKTLNLNYKSYIKNKINEMTYEEIKNLLSKFYYLILHLKESIGIYEIEKCAGRGSTGRVCKLFLISYYRFINPNAC